MKRFALLAFFVLVAFLPHPAVANSLLGTWVLNGGEPKPTYLQSMTITRLAFHASGKVDIRYLPQPPYMMSMLSPKNQLEAIAPRSTSLVFNDKGTAVEFAFGSDLVEMKYEFRGPLLLLYPTPSMGGPVKIYRRVIL